MISVVLCDSLCLCGEIFRNVIYHRDTEDHRDSQRKL